MKENATIFDYARMCNSKETCNDCPLGINNNGANIACSYLIRKNPDKANEIILNWCKEHPVETRQDRFLKMFPNAQKLNTGMTEENFVVEYCSECEHENEFRWNVKKFGYKAYCPHCGAVLMLCDECNHSDDKPLKCIDVTTPIFECARTQRSDTE